MCIFEFVIYTLHEIRTASWSTVWAAIQAIFVPIAVAAPIAFASFQARNRRRDDVQAYADLNWYVVRFLCPLSEADLSDEKTYLDYKTTLECCLRLTKQIGLEVIHPTHLSVHFANIDVHASRALAYMSLENPASFKSHYIHCAKIAEESMGEIDDYLRSIGRAPVRKR